MGVSNEATREHVINLVNLCNYILQPVRDEFGPIRINSGYRSPALNSKVGGSKTSQHCNGEAADFESSRISNTELATWIAKNLDFGSVWINGWFIGGLQAPTGGVKMSGIGRERGLPGIQNYLSIKNIGIKI